VCRFRLFVIRRECSRGTVKIRAFRKVIRSKMRDTDILIQMIFVMNMEIANGFETLVATYQIARYRNLEDRNTDLLP
jgi:hypothetical protein